MIDLIIFRDHQLGDKKSALCYAIGEVAREDDDEVVLRFWGCVNDDEDDDSNDEYQTILKSTILGRLRAKNWQPVD
jgi:hypothetical protein